MTGSLTIGTLARQAAVNVETIRFYQRRRLLDEPDKPPGGIRRYTQTHARRIRFIKEAQKLGLIRTILPVHAGVEAEDGEEEAAREKLEVCD